MLEMDGSYSTYDAEARFDTFPATHPWCFVTRIDDDDLYDKQPEPPEIKPLTATRVQEPKEGSRLKHFWPAEKQYFAGRVECSFENGRWPVTQIRYDDGDGKLVALPVEKWTTHLQSKKQK